MFNHKNFDSDKIFEKFMDMSGEECKAMLFGVLMGIGLSDMMNEKTDNETHRRSNDQIRQDFRKIRLVFNDKEDAWDVLDEMRDKIKEEGIASVEDLCRKADLPVNYEMAKWGWRNLTMAGIIREGTNYVLKMPPADYIGDHHTPEVFNRITFLYKDLDEARDALDELKEAIIGSRYDFITVQDAIIITGQNFYMMPKDKVASSLYGWDDLDDVFVALDHRYCGEGKRWIINMPPAKSIDPCPQPKHAS